MESFLHKKLVSLPGYGTDNLKVSCPLLSLPVFTQKTLYLASRFSHPLPSFALLNSLLSTTIPEMEKKHPAESDLSELALAVSGSVTNTIYSIRCKIRTTT